MTTVRQRAMEQWAKALRGEDDTKKKVDEPSGTAIDVELLDGPRKGDKLRLVNPPPSKIRLIVPGTSLDWCTYEYIGEGTYKYIGDIPLNTGMQWSYSSVG